MEKNYAYAFPAYELTEFKLTSPTDKERNLVINCSELNNYAF